MVNKSRFFLPVVPPTEGPAILSRLEAEGFEIVSAVVAVVPMGGSAVPSVSICAKISAALPLTPLEEEAAKMASRRIITPGRG